MCTHSLRTSFLGSTVSTGGAWTYVGFNEFHKQGPFTSNAATPPAALVGAVPLALVGDNPSVDWNGADDGYYFFTYDTPSCGGQTELLVHVKESCFNSNVTINVHNQQDPIDLNDLIFEGLSCTPADGFWYHTSGLVAAFDGLSGTFYPQMTSNGTTHTMEYIVARNCSDCKASVTINVYDCGTNNLCYLYTDFSPTNEQVDLDNSQILYFKVGGVDQMVAPVTGLGPKNVINYGAAPYLTNFVDALNDLNLDCFNFYYATYTLAPETRQKWMRMCYPQNVDWEFKVYSDGGAGGGTYWLYTPSGISYSYDDISYSTLFSAGFYNVTALGTTGIETCITVASCE